MQLFRLASPGSPRTFAITVALVAAACVTWLAWRWLTPTVEARLPSNEFADCTFETLPDHTPIGETFEMAAGTGTYAEIRIERSKSTPDVYEGLPVQPFQEWPVSLWIYPVGKEMIDGYCAGTWRYPDEKGKTPRPFLSKGSLYWGYQETGYKGRLPRPKDHPIDPNVIVCWTYVSSIPEKTGDLLYEISVYPTATPGKGTYHRYGKRLILKRGILRILPTRDEGQTNPSQD